MSRGVLSADVRLPNLPSRAYAMGMSAHDVSTEWTAEQALALPEDGNRYEVLDGELFVTPAPTWGHQSVLMRLLLALAPYVESNRLGWLRWSPADIVFSSKRLVQPDLFVVPWRPEGQPKAWSDVKHLLLAVEALSPSTARVDRHRKRPIYQDQGVNEYWIVDADARAVERWRPADKLPEIITETLAWRPRAGVEPLRIELPQLFDEAHTR